MAGRFVGVEPDTSVAPGAYFGAVHACALEDAPIEPNSVDVAYAIMVLEHLADPRPFWDKVWRALRPGGVFWGLTVDRRPWFCNFSLWFERLGIKDIYLNFLLGRRGTARYENYPVYYRSNAPDDVERFTRRFVRRDDVNFSRVGQCNDDFPRPLRPVASAWDSSALRPDRPGCLLAVHAQ